MKKLFTVDDFIVAGISGIGDGSGGFVFDELRRRYRLARFSKGAHCLR